MQEKGPIGISLTTDFNGSNNDPAEPIHQMAEAGFSMAHWCHEWNTAHIYSKGEMKQFADTFRQTGITLIDVHASEGSVKEGAYWLSPDEGVRQAGIKLIANRLEMTEYLGGRAAVLHVPGIGDERLNWQVFDASMSDLLPVIEQTGVKIAFENLYATDIYPDNMESLLRIVQAYSPEHVGICLDSGHFNLSPWNYSDNSPLQDLKDRIIAVHLHDNRGIDHMYPTEVYDDHKMPFTGTVDWSGVTEFLAQSSYQGPMTSEASLKIHAQEGLTVNEFLSESFTRGVVLAGMVQEARNTITSSLASRGVQSG